MASSKYKSENFFEVKRPRDTINLHTKKLVNGEKCWHDNIVNM